MRPARRAAPAPGSASAAGLLFICALLCAAGGGASPAASPAAYAGVPDGAGVPAGSPLAAGSAPSWAAAPPVATYNDSDAAAGCSRELSRHARHALREYFLPAATRLRYVYPPGRLCPLDPAADVLTLHEGAKRPIHTAQWRCSLCGKLFISEAYLDLHLGNRHGNATPPGAHACLADHCAVLHCAAGQKRPAARRRLACVPGAGASSTATLRARCDALGDACFPPDGPPATRALRELFRAQFCAAHSCEHGRPKPFTRGRQGEGPLRALQLSFAALAAVGLILYYVVLALNWTPASRMSDLRRIARPGAGAGGRAGGGGWAATLGGLLARKKKVY